jgi:putative phage-type endonuclease
MEQRSEEWFEIRKGRVTGSAVGAILGIAPFANQADILRRMVRDWHKAPSEFTGNIATNWGVQNESGALVEYEMTTGNTVQPCAFYQYEHWLGASPDGLVGDLGLVEIKCPFGIRYKKPPVFKTAKDQTHYYAQMQIQLHVTNRDWCDFYQWTPYGDLLERIDRDESFLATVLPVLKNFYDKYIREREFPNAEKYLDGQKKQLQVPQA